MKREFGSYEEHDDLESGRLSVTSLITVIRSFVPSLGYYMLRCSVLHAGIFESRHPFATLENNPRRKQRDIAGISYTIYNSSNRSRIFYMIESQGLSFVWDFILEMIFANFLAAFITIMPAVLFAVAVAATNGNNETVQTPGSRYSPRLFNNSGKTLRQLPVCLFLLLLLLLLARVHWFHLNERNRLCRFTMYLHTPSKIHCECFDTFHSDSVKRMKIHWNHFFFFLFFLLNFLIRTDHLYIYIYYCSLY